MHHEQSLSTTLTTTLTTTTVTASIAATTVTSSVAAGDASYRRSRPSESCQCVTEPWTLEWRLRRRQLHRRRPHYRHELCQPCQFIVLFDE